MSSAPVSVIGKTDDLRIRGVRALIAPQLLAEQLPVDAEALATVGNARRSIHRVLHGADDRLVAVVGPCSIHDYDAALEYGVSITDACLGWDDTVKVLDTLASAVRQRRVIPEEPEE